MNKEYSLKTNNKFAQFKMKNIECSHEDVANGNPYNTTAMIEVVSGNYSAISQFEFDIVLFKEFIVSMCNAYDKLNGQATLKDIRYSSEIKFDFKLNGHISVTGILYDEARSQELKFEFLTDQTSILDFSKELYKDWIK